MLGRHSKSITGTSGQDSEFDDVRKGSFVLRYRDYLVFSALFALVGLCTFSWFLLYGRTLICKTDGFFQYVPMLRSLREFCKQILKGEGVPLWSWPAALGSDVIGSMYAVYCDPFSYIAAAFPPNLVDVGFGISEYLRLYSAGLGMLAFLRYQKNPSALCIGGALCYSFAAWNLGSLIQCFFLTPLVLFPLIILGVDHIFDDGKPTLFVFSVVLSLVSCVYFAYMSAFFTVLYIAVRYFTQARSRTMLGFLRAMGYFVVLTIGACLVSMPVMIPVVQAILRANKSGGNDVTMFFTLRQMLSYLPAYVSAEQYYGNYSALCCGGLPIALSPFAIGGLCKKRSRPSAIMFLICVTFTLFPIFGSILNGFSYPTARWGYAFSFFFIWAGIEGYVAQVGERDQSRMLTAIAWVPVAILALSVIVVCTLGIQPQWSTLISLCTICSALVIQHFLSARTNESRNVLDRAPGLCALVAANLAVSGLIYFCPFVGGSFASYTERGVSYEQHSHSVLSLEKNNADIVDGRIGYVEHVGANPSAGTLEYYHLAANEPIYNQVPSTYGYLSTIDARLTAFFRSVCDTACLEKRVVCFPAEQRVREDFLMGVSKYRCTPNVVGYVSNAYRQQGSGDGTTFTSRIATGLGYVFDGYMTQKDFESLPVLVRQQALMDGVVVDGEPETTLTRLDSSAYDSLVEEVPIKVVDGSGITYEDGKLTVLQAGATLTIELQSAAKTDCETYLSICGLHRAEKQLSQVKSEELGEVYTALDRDKFALSHLSYKPSSSFEVFVHGNGVVRRFTNETGQNNQAITDICDYLIKVDGGLGPATEIVLQFQYPGQYSIESLNTYRINQESFEKSAEKLSDNRLRLTSSSANRLDGTVESNGGVLFLSIPNDGGWQVLVDGKHKDVFTVDYAFMGIEVDPGAHDVVLLYRPLGIRLGIPCLVIGIAFLVLCMKRFRISLDD